MMSSLPNPLQAMDRAATPEPSQTGGHHAVSCAFPLKHEDISILSKHIVIKGMLSQLKNSAEINNLPLLALITLKILNTIFP